MRLLVTIALILVIQTPQVPVSRNQHWNRVVVDITALEDELPPVQEFLKAHEMESRLTESSLDVNTHLDEAIKAADNLSKHLKDLRKSIKEGG